MCKKVYISLGSNVGNRAENIKNALAEIGKIDGVWVLKCSAIYETAPWGYTEQDNFYNTVALLETKLSPETLLQHLLDIEQLGGRERLFKYAPRTIDIDILLVQNFSSNTEFLKVPHPLMKQRAFVLVPLAEIAEDGFEKEYGFNPISLVKKQNMAGIAKLLDFWNEQ